MEIKTSVRNYIGENCNKFFIIPAYQRGYKWGVLKSDSESSDASILVEDIIKAMHSKKKEYFIQGVTVYKNGTDVVLIDGQQRTTTLFILLSLLLDDDEKSKYLFFNDEFKIKYEIRETSYKYLAAICKNASSVDESLITQDIFFFKSAKEQMNRRINYYSNSENNHALKEYVLDHVKLFCIEVPESQATRIFSMLNGSKAFMKTDELVKAEYLSKASLYGQYGDSDKSNTISETMEILKKQIGEEWRITALRSQFARMWDKWLYWWNRPEVRIFYRCKSNPMGLLLEYFFENSLRNEQDRKERGIEYSNDPESVSSVFKAFQNILIKDPVNAKQNIEELRKMQKKFEDVFNEPHHYNYLGLALVCSRNKVDEKNAIQFFLNNFKNFDVTKHYVLLRLIGITSKDAQYLENEEIDNEVIARKVADAIKELSSKDIYNDEDRKEMAFRQLFRLNVEEANRRKQKFEFFYNENDELKAVYENKSLEHIWPKSRVIIKENDIDVCYDETGKLINIDTKDKETIRRSDLELQEVTEHSIGNLVFLHKSDNSKFNAKLPEDKKKVYFNLDPGNRLYSRCLLHTMSVFAFDNWGAEYAINNIVMNKEKTLQMIKKGYEDYVN